MIQTVFGFHLRRHALGRQLCSLNLHWKSEGNNLLLAVLQHNIIVAIHQLLTASQQRTLHRHGGRIELIAEGHTRRPVQRHIHLCVVLAAFTQLLIHAKRHQRDWGVIDTKGNRIGIFLSVIFIVAKQTHAVAVILLENNIRP